MKSKNLLKAGPDGFDAWSNNENLTPFVSDGPRPTSGPSVVCGNLLTPMQLSEVGVLVSEG